MSTSIYNETAPASSSDFVAPNNITIAKSFSPRLILCKTIYPDREVAYDNVRYYQFFNRPIDNLQELLPLIQVLLHKQQCCIIRGVCIDDSKIKQRRLLHDDKTTGEYATVIEQEQNWYALDVDGYGECSGDIKTDARTVLLALGLPNVEAFAIPSAGYLRKTGIHLRLFLWNSVRVSCIALKKHYDDRKHVIDLALFGAVQPIYTARPRFIGLSDPCKTMIVWLAGETQYTEVPKIYQNMDDRPEDKYTKKQAERFFNNILQQVFDVTDKKHNWLYNRSIALGKWIGQDLLDEETTVDELYMTTAVWRGDRKRDMDTIRDGIKRGKQKMEGERNEF